MGDRDGLEKSIPEPVLEIGRRISAAGGAAYVVGGWVRDTIMGIDCKDVDLAVSLPVERTRDALSSLGKVHPLGERFGTVGVELSDYSLEITTMRRDRYRHGSRHPEVEPAGSIEEDLARRDFTINSMAVPLAPEVGPIIDPFGGREDIRKRVIKTHGAPLPRMEEDPLRMMRAVRLAAQLGFEIDPELMSVLKSESELLDAISWERRREELERTLSSPHAGRGVRILVDTGLMEYIAPEVSGMKGVEQPRAYHRADVLEHTLLTVMYLPAKPLLRRAALFHDVGKPATRVVSPKVMFPEHEKVGEQFTRTAMKRLRYSRGEIDRTAFLVRRHTRAIRYDPGWSDSAVRRLVRDCTMTRGGEVVVPLEDSFELAEADIRAGNLEKAGEFIRRIEGLRNRIESVEEKDEIVTARSPLGGRELMDLFERGPGPWIRPVKSYLEDLVAAGELERGDKEKAAGLAIDFYRKEGL